LAPVLMIWLPYFLNHLESSRLSQTRPAGLQMSGWMVPSTISCIDWPEPMGVALTVIGPSQAAILRLLKPGTTALIHASFSLP